MKVEVGLRRGWLLGDRSGCVINYYCALNDNHKANVVLTAITLNNIWPFWIMEACKFIHVFTVQCSYPFHWKKLNVCWLILKISFVQIVSMLIIKLLIERLWPDSLLGYLSNFDSPSPFFEMFFNIVQVVWNSNFNNIDDIQYKTKTFRMLNE